MPVRWKQKMRRRPARSWDKRFLIVVGRIPGRFTSSVCWHEDLKGIGNTTTRAEPVGAHSPRPPTTLVLSAPQHSNATFRKVVPVISQSRGPAQDKYRESRFSGGSFPGARTCRLLRNHCGYAERDEPQNEEHFHQDLHIGRDTSGRRSAH